MRWISNDGLATNRKIAAAGVVETRRVRGPDWEVEITLFSKRNSLIIAHGSEVVETLGWLLSPQRQT